MEDGPVIPSKKKFPDTSQFGPEFEMFGTVNNMEDVVAILIRNGVPATITNRQNKSYDKWHIEHDGSLKPDREDHLPFELIGPVLRGESGLHEIKKVLIIINEVDPKVNKSCGFHVHFGPETWGGNPQNLKAIVKNYIKFEEAFNVMVPHSRRISDYCLENNSSPQLRHLNPKEKFALIDGCNTREQIEAIIQDTRYYRLNLSTGKVTIEFRQHSATYEWKKACTWIKLLSLFIKASCDNPPTLNFNSDKDSDYKFNKLFEIVIKDATLESWARKRKEKFDQQ